MKPRSVAAILTAGAMIAPAVAEPPHFKHEDIEQGRALFQRTCSHCHGINMVNSGTTVYDLRRFPVDDPARFLNSVANGKGNMPSWKDVLTPEQIELLWAYVGSRGGKEP